MQSIYDLSCLYKKAYAAIFVILFCGIIRQAARLKIGLAHTSLQRLMQRARRLYEQGASWARLREYVVRWHRWLRGGVDDLVELCDCGLKNGQLIKRYNFL